MLSHLLLGKSLTNIACWCPVPQGPRPARILRRPNIPCEIVLTGTQVLIKGAMVRSRGLEPFAHCDLHPLLEFVATPSANMRTAKLGRPRTRPNVTLSLCAAAIHSSGHRVRGVRP